MDAVAASCPDEQSPGEAERAVPEAPAAAHQGSNLLNNLPVTGSLAGGGTFESLLSIQSGPLAGPQNLLDQITMPRRGTPSRSGAPQNDTSSPMVGSVGNMLMPLRVGGELS